jgi:hypothetical protein
MRHATDADLDRLEPLLEALRGRDALKERRRGTFYLRSRAFLHFHGHGDELYADVRLDGVDFERREVTTEAQQAMLLGEIDACLDRT